MPNNKFKAKVVFLFNNNTFSFIYNIKINQFPNLKLFYINNF